MSYLYHSEQGMESRNDSNGSNSATETFNQIKQHRRKLQGHRNLMECDKNISSIYKCKNCDFETNLKVSLKLHFNLRHKADPKNENEFITVMRQCGFCDFQTYSTLLLLKHYLECHERDNLLTDAACIHWLECGQCSFKTLHGSNLTKHMNLHKKKSIKIIWHHCVKCEFKTKWESVLKKHTATLHTEPTNKVWYNCDICEYKAEEESHLKQHKINVHQTNVRDIVNNNGDVVNFLLERSGSGNLSNDDRHFLKQLDRPTPSLNNLLNVNAHSSNRKFCASWYQKCKWLTGSEVRNKLYCWTCLLFNPPISKSPWHTIGFDNMKSLSRSIERHGVSKDHIYSAVKYKLFGANNNQNSLTSAHQDSVTRHNERVKENRDILRRLIDMTIYLSFQQLEFGCHNQEDDSQNQGNYRELAELLSTYDSKFEELLKSSSVFSEMSHTIQNDLIDSIKHVILESIESEILNSLCFSWEVDSCQTQLSVIFRYTHEGEIVERFLGFFDVGAGRTADDLFNFLSLQFEKFNLKDKLVGQTYDGASVMSGDLNELQSRIKTIAPQALFTHCHAHRLDLILQDSVSSIQECKIFFAIVSGISDFFSKSTKRTKVLDNVCKRRVPGNAQIRWNFKSRIVNTLLAYREELLEAFEEITDSNDFAKDFTSIRESASYIDFLNDFDNLFLLYVFSVIFQQTDLIYSIIQSESKDILYSKFQVENFLSRIKSFRQDESQFHAVYGNTVKVLGVPSKRRKSNLPDNANDIPLHYKRLYHELLDVIIAQLQDRFLDFDKLQIFDLLNSDKFASFEKYFPVDILNLLVKNYPKFFNKERLEMELKILYSDATILGESTELKDMLKFLTVNSLQEDVPELFKLLSLILSLSVTSASVEPSYSGLKRVTNYVRNSVSMSQSPSSNLSSITIEKEMVKSLRKTPNFFDRVIDHFAQSKNRGMALTYKNL